MHRRNSFSVSQDLSTRQDWPGKKSHGHVFPVIHCSSLDAQNKDLGADLQTFLIVFNCVSSFVLTLAFSTNKKPAGIYVTVSSLLLSFCLKEIIVKAISGVLFLLLKHFKLNHIYQVRSTLTAQKI